MDKGAQRYQEEIERYPRRFEAYGLLGLVFDQEGQYEKAVEIKRGALRLRPDWVGSYLGIANYALASRRFNEARQSIYEAQARKLDNFQFHNALYALAFQCEVSHTLDAHNSWFTSITATNFDLPPKPH